MFSRVSELYQEIWKAIIRPPRAHYTIEQLGKPDFTSYGRRYKRRDFELINGRGMKIQCSHFEPVDRYGNYERRAKYPCVIYLHGNCSSRLEAIYSGCLDVLLPLEISVFCFDFSGSGLSDGDYVSLGWYESEDLNLVVKHLRQLGRVSAVGLWGRSMGAVTACLFAQRDPSLAAMVLDSPFASLQLLATELAAEFVGYKVPKFFVTSALYVVRNTILAKAKFDIHSLEPIKLCNSSYIPAFFLAAKDDSFIRPHHTQRLHDAYAGDKNIRLVEGGHNTLRPYYINDSIRQFFFSALKVTPQQLLGVNGPLSASGTRSPSVWESVAVRLALENWRRRRLHTSTGDIPFGDEGEQRPLSEEETTALGDSEFHSLVVDMFCDSNNECNGGACLSPKDESSEPVRQHLQVLDEEHNGNPDDSAPKQRRNWRRQLARLHSRRLVISTGCSSTGSSTPAAMSPRRAFPTDATGFRRTSTRLQMRHPDLAFGYHTMGSPLPSGRVSRSPCTSGTKKGTSHL